MVGALRRTTWPGLEMRPPVRGLLPYLCVNLMLITDRPCAGLHQRERYLRESSPRSLQLLCLTRTPLLLTPAIVCMYLELERKQVSRSV